MVKLRMLHLVRKFFHISFHFCRIIYRISGNVMRNTARRTDIALAQASINITRYELSCLMNWRWMDNRIVRREIDGRKNQPMLYASWNDIASFFFVGLMECDWASKRQTDYCQCTDIVVVVVVGDEMLTQLKCQHNKWCSHLRKSLKANRSIRYRLAKIAHAYTLVSDRWMKRFPFFFS